jgi:hypothetical protein
MVMRYHWGHAVGHTYAHHTIRTLGPILSNSNVEMEDRDSCLLKSTQDISQLGKQGLTLRSGVDDDNYDKDADDNDNDDNDDDDNDNDDDNNDDDDNDDDDDDNDNNAEEFDEGYDNKESDEEDAARYEMYGC